MKKKERYKLLNYAKNQYNEAFDLDFRFKYLSKKELYKLLETHKHSSMCELDYCCYGLYKNCWQELIGDGIWDLTQERADKIIKDTIDETAKACRKDSRILHCKLDNRIDVIIVMRDICKRDYLITFTNEEGW